MEETEALLRSYDVPEDIIENFMRNGITIDIFTKLSEAHLQELCPHLGTRIRLSDLITTANVPTATETNASHTVSDRSISKIDDIVIIPTTPPTPSSSANTGNLVITRCFPEFDLKTLLQTSIGGASIIKFYETNHKLNDTKRNQLTDIIIKHIYTHLVHHKITHEEYNILQAKIVTIFPTESPTTYFTRPVGKRDSISGRPIAARGKLVDKVRNLLYKYGEKRKSTSDEDPPMKKKSTTQEVIDEDIIWLKANREPWDQVVEKWKNTSALRHESISDSCNVHDIYIDWPILNDPRSDSLICIDFEAKYPASGLNFYMYWNKFFNDILNLKNSKDEAILNAIQAIANLDEDQKLPSQLEILLKLIPPKGRLNKKVKFSTQEAADSLFILVTNAGDIDSKIEEVKEKAKSQKQLVQPYIILQGTITNCVSPLLVIDSIKYSFNSLASAFDTLFKAFHVFNARYPRASEHLHLLIQRCVYKIKTKYDNVVPYIANILMTLDTDENM